MVTVMTSCELCAAARVTDWFHEDDECWIAECEMCAVPMAVWRVHAPTAPSAVRTRLVALLESVVVRHYDFGDAGHWIDDDMRSIPGHYHVHARPRTVFTGHGLRRRPSADQAEVTS